MAKGYEENRARLGQLNFLGKSLARRSGRKCELCGAGGTELRAYEIAPVPPEPQLENTLFLCLECMEQIRDPRKMTPARWRPLESALWSTEPAIQVMAVRLLRRMAPSVRWALEALEGIDLEPEVEAWASGEDS